MRTTQHALSWEEQLTSYATSSGLLSSGVTSTTEGDAWNRCIEDLLKMPGLPDGWDGSDAVAPRADIVDSAIALINLLQDDPEALPPSRVVASPNGTIILEWQMGPDYMEAEVIEPYHAECLLHRPGKPEAYWEIPWSPLTSQEESGRSAVSEPVQLVEETASGSVLSVA